MHKPLKLLKIENSAALYLDAFGMAVFGWFRYDETRVGLLVGNFGSAIWEPFAASTFFGDGGSDPMNRWTQSVLEPMGDSAGGEVVFPFGDQVWPFQRWAQQAMGVRSSPLGLMIHPRFGLWFALRGAILVEDHGWSIEMPELAHPCSNCEDKPCLSSCPVGAFTSEGYDYETCRSHVNSKVGRDCLSGGCLARLACPVGYDFQYHRDHQAFHMKHFA